MNYKIKIPIYYINLKKSVDRRLEIEKQLKIHSNTYQRVGAVDGRRINKRIDEIDNIKYNIPKKYKYNKNEIGCLLSHIKTILQIEKDNIEYAMIIEDDMNFYFKNKWAETIETIIKNTPTDWNIIKLHHNNYNLLNKIYQNQYKYIKHIQVSQNWSTGAYLINKKGIRELKNTFLTNNQWTFIPIQNYNKITADKIMYDIHNVYNYTKPLFLVGNFNSTIQSRKNIDDKGRSKADTITNIVVSRFYLSN